MIDIHSHVLFGVDDGCSTIEESVEMIESAFYYGVTDIILTPHYSYKRKFTSSKTILNRNFKALKEVLNKKNIEVNLYLGSEIDETDDIHEFLKNEECNTMNDTKYVLIDFGMRKCDIDDYCYELIVRGYTPIIAHPERYQYVDDINIYKKWKKTGALIQINANNIFHAQNFQIKKMAKLALKNKLVDFIASDAHKNPNSFEYLEKAHEYMNKKNDKKYSDQVLNLNPKLLRGEKDENKL